MKSRWQTRGGFWLLGLVILVLGCNLTAQARGRRRERAPIVPAHALVVTAVPVVPLAVTKTPAPAAAAEIKPAPLSVEEPDPLVAEIARLRQQVGSPLSGAALSRWTGDAGPNFTEALTSVAQNSVAENRGAHKEAQPIAREAPPTAPPTIASTGLAAASVVSPAAGVLRAAAKELTQRSVEAEEAGDYPRADSLRQLAEGLWQEARLAADRNAAAAP